jgi:hypothetical protein
MKFRHQVLRVLPVVMMVCVVLPAPARAQFSQQGPKLVGTGALGIGSQGWSVSLSHDGNTAIVGAPGDNFEAGAAWVYTRSRGVWSQQVKLVGAGAFFPNQALQGISVSLSGDGNTGIVGGFNDGAAGAAWVFTRSGGVWSQEVKLVGTGNVGRAAQGISVSLSGDGNTAVVGGYDDNGAAGAAWVFTRSEGIWNQQAKLVGTDAVGPAQQGSSVSISSDGNTAIAGGPLDNGSVGAAWVYTRSGGVWAQQAKLVGTGAIGTFVRQGWSVSLSDDGNTAIVGGQGDNGDTGLGVGAAWVYTRSGSVWTQQGPKLVGAGNVGNARQGESVSLSGDGYTAILGGPGDSQNAGAAWLFAQPPVFAGTPGYSNCYGQSVSALVGQSGGLNGAAAALGYASVGALQDGILAVCGG